MSRARASRHAAAPDAGVGHLAPRPGIMGDGWLQWTAVGATRRAGSARVCWVAAAGGGSGSKPATRPVGRPVTRPVRRSVRAGNGSTDHGGGWAARPPRRPRPRVGHPAPRGGIAGGTMAGSVPESGTPTAHQQGRLPAPTAMRPPGKSKAAAGVAERSAAGAAEGAADPGNSTRSTRLPKQRRPGYTRGSRAANSRLLGRLTCTNALAASTGRSR